MSGKPHFLPLLLVGSLALAISLTTPIKFSRNRGGHLPENSSALPESAERTNAPGATGEAGQSEDPSDAAASRIGNMPAGQAPPAASLAQKATPMIEVLARYSRPSVDSGTSPSSGQSPAEASGHVQRLSLTEPLRNPSPLAAATTAASSGSAGIPDPAGNGLFQRKVPLFARGRPSDRIALPPPPVINPITNPNSDPQRDPVLPDPGDDGTDEGSGANGAANNPPSADAGDDRTVCVGDVVTLDGSGSVDVDGDSLTFRWTFAAKPAASNASFSDPAAVATAFTADVAGVYIVQLVVDDGSDESLPQMVILTAELRGLTVPQVVGLSLAQARVVLADARLKVGCIRTVPNPVVPKNKIVEQQPAAKSPVTEGAAVNLVISFPSRDDDDQDGLPDAWEYARFGHLDQAGQDDPDGDGYSNYQEYLVDTDPADRADAPVPAGNFFEYDAFGRIVVKQITLEP
jgi:hypothetical protein